MWQTVASAILGCLRRATAAAGQVAANSSGGFNYPPPTGRLQVGLFAFVQTTENFLADARNGDTFLNTPFVVAVVTVIGCLLWLLVPPM